MRRDSNDKKWKDVKVKVSERDHNQCRLCRVLSVKEFIELKKNAGMNLSKLDPAHFISVSHDPSLCYEENNICLLNHYSHSMLDDCKNPLNGNYINIEEVNKWWLRILQGNPNQFNFLKQKELI